VIKSTSFEVKNLDFGAKRLIFEMYHLQADRFLGKVKINLSFFSCKIRIIILVLQGLSEVMRKLPFAW
jgi:hypothetical protein